jgi:hypothetical protein
MQSAIQAAFWIAPASQMVVANDDEYSHSSHGALLLAMTI